MSSLKLELDKSNPGFVRSPSEEFQDYEFELGFVPAGSLSSKSDSPIYKSRPKRTSTLGSQDFSNQQVIEYTSFENKTESQDFYTSFSSQLGSSQRVQRLAATQQLSDTSDSAQVPRLRALLKELYAENEKLRKVKEFQDKKVSTEDNSQENLEAMNYHYEKQNNLLRIELENCNKELKKSDKRYAGLATRLEESEHIRTEYESCLNYILSELETLHAQEKPCNFKSEYIINYLRSQFQVFKSQCLRKDSENLKLRDKLKRLTQEKELIEQKNKECLEIISQLNSRLRSAQSLHTTVQKPLKGFATARFANLEESTLTEIPPLSEPDEDLFKNNFQPPGKPKKVSVVEQNLNNYLEALHDLRNISNRATKTLETSSKHRRIVSMSQRSTPNRTSSTTAQHSRLDHKDF